MALDIPRLDNRFEVVSEYVPSGDQPAAIEQLARRVRGGERHTVLLGATGTGKSATTAWLVERLQRPTLVLAHNKTLAAQLATEFRGLMPNNAVEYFVSYYDYYQPEAYIPQTDTYIEKDSSVNEEVERLRHSATMSLLTRRDVIVVATVSASTVWARPRSIWTGPQVTVGQELERDKLLRRLVDIQYTRNDLAFNRGTFRVRGDTLEIIPAYEELAIRIEFFGDEIERLSYLHPLTGDVIRRVDQLTLPRDALRRRPRAHGAGDLADRGRAGGAARRARPRGQAARGAAAADAHHLRHRDDAPGRLLLRHRELLPPHRRPRGGQPAALPARLLPRRLPAVIDESHATVPQIGGMYEGDASRKRTLVEHGFRLPSAQDNRPLRFDEFDERVGQTVYLSATPGPWELGRTRASSSSRSSARPASSTREVILKPTKGQIDDLCTRSASGSSSTSGSSSRR